MKTDTINKRTGTTGIRITADSEKAFLENAMKKGRKIASMFPDKEFAELGKLVFHWYILADAQAVIHNDDNHRNIADSLFFVLQQVGFDVNRCSQEDLDQFLKEVNHD